MSAATMTSTTVDIKAVEPVVDAAAVESAVETIVDTAVAAVETVVETAVSAVETAASEEKRQVSHQWKPVRKSRKSSNVSKRRDFTAENSDPEGTVSFCLPFVHKSVSPKKVFAVFRQGYIEMIGEDIPREQFFTRLGFIERIDYTQRKDGNRTYYIHFENGRYAGNSRNRNQDAIEFLNHMKNGGKAKIFTDRARDDDQDYRDDRRFWWVTISRNKRPEDHDDVAVSHDISSDMTE